MRATTAIALSVSLIVLAGCDTFDSDFRGLGGGFNTSEAALRATESRPDPDNRGILSYPGYQVAVARRGDTVTSVASRVGLPAGELATYNAVPEGATLNKGEVLALPRRVAEPSPATGAPVTGPIQPPEQVDVAVLADGAITRAEQSAPATRTSNAQTGQEPVRHKVVAGETAYIVARRYGVSLKALDEWNGLDDDYTLRTGQFLLIPPESTSPAPARRTSVSEPGEGSPTPTPPSASKPLPKDEPTTAQTQSSTAKAAPGTPDSPDLGTQATKASASSSRFVSPVDGKIIRVFSAKSNGIDIQANAGAPVRAADKGTVARILETASGVQVLLIGHEGGIFTVYSNVEGFKVKKGDRVKRGQVVASVPAKEPTFLHFEVRRGVDPIDPADYLP